MKFCTLNSWWAVAIDIPLLALVSTACKAQGDTVTDNATAASSATASHKVLSELHAKLEACSAAVAVTRSEHCLSCKNSRLGLSANLTENTDWWRPIMVRDYKHCFNNNFKEGIPIGLKHFQSNPS
jgi:hypothetical protein